MTDGAVSDSGAADSRDGRRVRGERRRRAIVDAALRVVERDGVAGVSHRAIAREADVPPASIAYHFATIDDLLVATLLDSVDTLLAELDRLADTLDGDRAGWPAAVAGLLASLVSEHRGRTLAEYELYLLAARRPALRPAARRWIEAAAGHVTAGGRSPETARTLFAVIDGMLMHALVADEPPTAAEFESALTSLWPSAWGEPANG